jgi:hypothetical protein
MFGGTVWLCFGDGGKFAEYNLGGVEVFVEFFLGVEGLRRAVVKHALQEFVAGCPIVFCTAVVRPFSFWCKDVAYGVWWSLSLNN